MTHEQSKFIRQLKITLIAVLSPFIIALSGSAIADHFAVKENRKHIEAVENAYVSRDVFLLYINELRTANNLLREDVDQNEIELKAQLDLIDTRLNELMREVYKTTTRKPGHDSLSMSGN